MIQRAASRDVIPDAVVRRITSAITPWRIVLFGSRARGSAKEDSDYDFYVEVNADSDALRGVDDQIRDLCVGIAPMLDFKIVCRGDLERRRNDPGTIEWDVAREGKVLYSNSSPRPFSRQRTASANPRPSRRNRRESGLKPRNAAPASSASNRLFLKATDGVGTVAKVYIRRCSSPCLQKAV